MSDVHIEYINEVYIRVITNNNILLELYNNFKYKIDNYQFHPLVRKKRWDGNVSLININTGICLSGICQRIKKYCDDNRYSISFDKELYYDSITKEDLFNHVKSLNIPEKFEIRDYQYLTAFKSIKSRRRLLLSPTNSGKTLISYIIGSWYLKLGFKILYIVPTVDLVSQFTDDMKSFGYIDKISSSYSGLDKSLNIKENICCTTWQSLNNGKTSMPPEWYEQFDVVFGDECHQHAAKSVKEILENLSNCRYRFGMTGSLSGKELNDITIEGLFGPIFRTTTNKEMIERKYSSDINIKCIILKYDNNLTKDLLSLTYKKEEKTKKYTDEISFLINSKERNRFIYNLVMSLKGNRLVFFKNIEQGKILFDLFKDLDDVYYIDGFTLKEDRKRIRDILKTKSNAILVASYGTTATGISISTLKHMIAASPSKSKVKVLQSIGRMLRADKSKVDTGAELYDIVDKFNTSEENYTLRHFRERLDIYNKEKFNHKIFNLDIK